MTFENYTEQRNALVQESEELINAGLLEDAQAKMKKIESLDAQFEAVKLEMANLNALKEQTQTFELENKSIENKGDLTVMTKLENVQEMSNETLYVNAFAKTFMGQELTTQENAVFVEMNNHTTANTGVVIPTTTLNEIITEIEAQSPFYADAKKLQVKGFLSLPKHSAIVSGDAKSYLESEATETEVNTFIEVQLGAKEVSKYIEVSFKLDAMSIPAFLEYLKGEIVERVGTELGRQSISGNGVKEMTGVLTALAGVTSQQSTYDATAGLVYSDLTNAVSKIGAKHITGTAIYASNSTVWNVLGNVVDGNGRPLFISDVVTGGVGRALGFPVKVDSAIPDGTIIIGNAKGYAVNTNQSIGVESERDLKARKTGFSAYTIVDGNVTHEKAFSILAPQV
ncbi:HK97 family phage major capsid protein [Ureibacillus xyleni]|uniref:HK97 family phage major capsid protein n=1 Tax=Ureibacillus xyleni TaxID=614648 RepID=A0A285SWW6_9BACL|nr:phage major capsid protein [Ureibacillus xyleni]SOC12845.1 HK97 family phage major capsid protein [Ureibacillus xyleni]